MATLKKSYYFTWVIIPGGCRGRPGGFLSLSKSFQPGGYSSSGSGSNGRNGSGRNGGGGNVGVGRDGPKVSHQPDKHSPSNESRLRYCNSLWRAKINKSSVVIDVTLSICWLNEELMLSLWHEDLSSSLSLTHFLIKSSFSLAFSMVYN